MKKIVFIISVLFLISTSLFASVPELENGTVISLSDYSEKFKDNIILTNYSSLSEIDIEFSIYKDSKWISIGKITGCPFGNEVKLITKEKFKNISFIGYKAELPSDKKVSIDVRHHDLRLYIIESSNNYFGSAKDFSNVTESPSNGIYKFDTTEQRRDYEDDVRVQNAPKSIIMFKSPDYGTWDVYATISGNKVNNYYHDDIDDYAPYWIIQVIDEHKFYTISAFSKNDNLNFTFQKTDHIEEKFTSENDVESQLLKIKHLYEKGIINEDEYKASRLKILGL
ncbi:MAG: hypothetical protein IJP90_01810 [Treponema sp.]|nr:hypothetical protein [Treponema sp.]